MGLHPCHGHLPAQTQFHAFLIACERVDMAELTAVGYGRGGAATNNRDLAKSRLNKDKFMWVLCCIALCVGLLMG